MIQHYLGIDIAKAKFDCALLQEGRYRAKAFANTPAGFDTLIAWLTSQGVTHDTLHACMEATGTYGEALATFLADHDWPISVVNPAQIKAFADSELSRNKTDQADARRIARFTAAMHPALWQPVPQEIRELQALVRRIDSLMTMRQQERNRHDTATPIVRDSIAKLIVWFDQEIEALQTRIRQHIDRHPDLRDQAKLLDTIPGVGEATIAAILAFIRVEAFPDSKSVSAFAGLSPVKHQSGSSVQRPAHISKIGPSLLRKALYMPALSASRCNPAIRQFYLRLKSAGKPGKAIVCAMMRKLLTLIYTILKSRQPFDPNKALANN